MRSSKPVIWLLAALGLAVLMPSGAQACGAETDCLLGERSYRVRMPPDHDGQSKVGAVVHLHGYRGSAAAVMRNKALGEAVAALGLALVAPTSKGDDWAIPGAPLLGDDELAYFDALLADLPARFAIDPARIMLTGFSAGGMTTWYLACHRGDRFAGFAPIAGTFWEPVPARCPSPPAHVLHLHGTSDSMVPLAGRAISKEQYPQIDQSAKQGDVEAVIEMYGRDGEFEVAEGYGIDGLTCERRINPTGKVLELCLHDGGHSFKPAYVVRAWRALEKLGAVSAE